MGPDAGAGNRRAKALSNGSNETGNRIQALTPPPFLRHLAAQLLTMGLLICYALLMSVTSTHSLHLFLL
eukprot:scaffold242909_cov18-Tisochrysis_lutea.AAC.1